MAANGTPAKKGKYDNKIVQKNLCGYLVAVGILRVTKPNQLHQSAVFPIKLQHGNNLKLIVLITPGASVTTNRIQQFVGKPVKLTKVNQKGSSYYFNESYGSKIEGVPFNMTHPLVYNTVTSSNIPVVENALLSITRMLHWLSGAEQTPSGAQVRQGVIQDQEGGILIAIWQEDRIKVLQEKNTYHFSDVKTSQWNGRIRLTTERLTVITPDESKPQMVLPEIDLTMYDTDLISINTPEIIGTFANVSKHCRHCSTTVVPEMNEVFIVCDNCDMEQMVEKLNTIKSIEIKVENVDMLLKVSPPQLEVYGDIGDEDLLRREMLTRPVFKLIYNARTESVFQINLLEENLIEENLIEENLIPLEDGEVDRSLVEVVEEVN